MVVSISDDIETLKKKLAEKDEKLKNQSTELNHLTNEIIPELKKSNKELRNLKMELTDALEYSTKKYFDQLEINADLSESVGKKGAALLKAKVRLDEIEKLVAEFESNDEVSNEQVGEDVGASLDNTEDIAHLNQKIKDLEKQLKSKDLDLDKKSSLLKNKDSELAELKDNLIPKFKAEANELKSQIKQLKSKADEEMSGVGGKIAKLEAEIKELSDKLDNKKRDYDKLNTTINAKDKTIKSLKAKNKKLMDDFKEKSNKGFFSRLTGR